MVASDYLYQFHDFYFTFAIIPQLQKEKIQATHNIHNFTQISGEKIPHVTEVLPQRAAFPVCSGISDLPLTRKV